MCETLKIAIFYMASIFWYMNLIQKYVAHFLHPITSSENKMLSNIFRGCRKESVCFTIESVFGKIRPGKVVYTLELPS